MTESQLVRRMNSLAEQWERDADRRAIFLRCYCMMTHNNLTAIERGLFEDGEWVTILLQRFADYYFDALALYDGPTRAASAPWCAAHDATRDAEVSPLQLLLLGVNAQPFQTRPIEVNDRQILIQHVDGLFGGIQQSDQFGRVDAL